MSNDFTEKGWERTATNLARDNQELRERNKELYGALKSMAKYPDVRAHVGTLIHDKALDALNKVKGDRNE